tara:strand:- start:173 stop:412 length:240 start_codon:yes stop_codon:yes gene_type:complete
MVVEPKQESLRLTAGFSSEYEDTSAGFSPEFPGCLPEHSKRTQPAFRRRHPNGTTQTRSGTFLIGTFFKNFLFCFIVHL